MRSKYLIVSSIVAMVLAIALNFNEMLMGSHASFKSVIVTIGYLVFWVIFTIMARKSEGTLVYSSVISAISLAVCLITLAINIYDWNVPIAIALVAIFLTPLYGIRIIFQKGFILSTISMSVICVVWFISSIALYKRTK